MESERPKFHMETNIFGEIKKTKTFDELKEGLQDLFENKLNEAIESNMNLLIFYKNKYNLREEFLKLLKKELENFGNGQQLEEIVDRTIESMIKTVRKDNNPVLPNSARVEHSGNWQTRRGYE